MAAPLEVLHALPNEELEGLVPQAQRQEVDRDFQVPNYRINVDLLLLTSDRVVHATRNFFTFERWQDPAERWLEPFKETRVDVVRVDVGHANWTPVELELLPQRIGESRECKLAGAVV